jgi:arabinogalactan endo-1,4-beta-galactosidase
VDPTKKGGVVNDIPYTLKIAKRITKASGKFLLDFHYSDTWTDPAHQQKPIAWNDMDYSTLLKKVKSYTHDTLMILRKEGCFPSKVQIGNEINPGMIHQDGEIYWKGEKKEKSWKQFCELFKAGIQGAKKAEHNNELEIIS